MFLQVLQPNHNCKNFCWATCWVPAVLVLGGEQPLIHRLIAVSTSPQLGSTYNMGVWDRAAATWLQVHVRPILNNEAATRPQYHVAGRSVDNWRCNEEPHIVVDRCWVSLCILHCCMAIGGLPVAFVEARLEALPKENGEAMQRTLCWARMGMKLGASAAPNKEETTALFLAWEEMGQVLAYAPDDPNGKAFLP